MKSYLIFLLAMGVCFGCKGQTQNENSGSAGFKQQEPRKVEIYDQGLKMWMSTVVLPPKWALEQDIAYDPNTGRPNRYKFVYIGPKNQYIRNYSGQFLYGNINNVAYQDAINKSIDHVLGVEQLENIQYTAFKPNKRMMEDSRFVSMAERLRSQGGILEAFETDFSGQRGGKEYKGKILLVNTYNSGGGFGIVGLASMLFSPAEFYQETLEIEEKISESSVLNPEHDRAMAEINARVIQQIKDQSQQWMNQSAKAHQRRMADQKAAFASHQKNMAGLNQIQDVAHESYLNKLRGTGTFSTVGSDYTTQDNIVDQIHERQSFQDPWTEKTISLDGQYEYNYTNGLGDYYRTNDASFDYNSLQGDWKPVKSLN